LAGGGTTFDLEEEIELFHRGRGTSKLFVKRYDGHLDAKNSDLRKVMADNTVAYRFFQTPEAILEEK